MVSETSFAFLEERVSAPRFDPVWFYKQTWKIVAGKAQAPMALFPPCRCYRQAAQTLRLQQPLRRCKIFPKAKAKAKAKTERCHVAAEHNSMSRLGIVAVSIHESWHTRRRGPRYLLGGTHNGGTMA